MNEIEKMYENANIEKEVIKGCYSIDDEYGNEEKWLGQSIYIKCNNCGKFFID